MFKGLAGPVVGSAFYNAVLFGVYESSLHELAHRRSDKKAQLSDFFFAGAAGTCCWKYLTWIGGFAQSLILCPIDVVKCKMQIMGLGHGHEAAAATHEAHPSTMSVARQVVNERGLQGLFLGIYKCF